MITVKIRSRPQNSVGYQPENQAYLIVGPYGWRISPNVRLWRPPTDVLETEEQIIVIVEIPGMSDDEFSIHFGNNILSIQGTRIDKTEKRSYHQMEIHFGQFASEVNIPIPIEVEKIEAIYEGGFLQVYLPKARPTNISISTKDE